MKNYSQTEEQAVLLELFAKIDNGRVLDIGAFDGETNSNSRALIEQGWGGVLIEPSPSAFLSLLSLYSGNDKVRLINAAFGMENWLREFHECEGDQCSTFDSRIRELWAEEGRKYRTYWVAQMTAAMLTNQIEGRYDVISIDTEGSSFDILKALPIGSWCPKAIVVEHDSRIVEMAEWARARNYRTVNVDAQNLILVRK